MKLNHNHIVVTSVGTSPASYNRMLILLYYMHILVRKGLHDINFLVNPPIWVQGRPACFRSVL